jgi:methionyl-tRNA synthetase
LTTSFEVLEALSLMIWPVMPGKADDLRAQLGLKPVTPRAGADVWPSRWPERGAGELLGKPAPLFPRIEPDREAELLQSLGMDTAATVTSTSNATSAATTTSSPTSTISYDDFSKLDLRVGVVVAAERVKGKDKLLSLRVDLGEPEPRPIIAALALSFAPEALVGRRVVVVTNLEPRKFGKDLESRGMILATGPSEALSLVSIGQEAAAGSKIK